VTLDDVRVLAVVHQADAGLGVFADSVRERGDELLSWSPPEQPAPELGGIDAVIVLGGAMNVHEEVEYPWLAAEKRVLARVLDERLPALGVCLGSELLADAAGAPVSRCSAPEIGWHPVEVLPPGADDPLFGPLPERFEGFQWHGYGFGLPPGASALARSAVCLQGYRLDGRIWGIQFHAEVSWESIKGWLADCRSDPDAVRIGLDPTRLLEESAPRIERWNKVGRGICERFLEAAERAV
jgi:GMP synthase (glutamine-hydrolysing)